MIQIETAAFQKSLEDYKQKLTLALENAVKEFAVGIVKDVIPSTPYGDSRTFLSLYEYRNSTNASYPIEEGMTIGNWDISVKTYSPVVDYVADNLQGTHALADSKRHVATYKLGDTVYLHNTTPYLQDMHGPQVRILVQALQNLYVSAAKFKDYMQQR